MTFNILDYPIVLREPARMTTVTAWSEHVPFAMFIMQLHQPKSFVELGTFAGDSYCAFCQAVAELNLPTQCMAVDTWQGDPHTGTYPEELFTHLNQYNDSTYKNFSRLNRTNFDAAAKDVPDHSIDLLHIDGLHTYEAVKHDFETWLPKMSDQGLVLFHDTAVREGDFGVYRLFPEVSTGRLAFEFSHCAGLGVLAVGNKLPTQTIAFLTDAIANPEFYRSLFFRLGNAIGERVVRARQMEQLQRILNAITDWRSQNKLPIDAEWKDRSLFQNNPNKVFDALWQQLHMTVLEYNQLKSRVDGSR